MNRLKLLLLLNALKSIMIVCPIFTIILILYAKSSLIVVDCQLINDVNNTIPNDLSVFIEFTTLEEIILAEPDTLFTLREANVSITSSRSLDYNLTIGWRIEPVDNRKFQETEGLIPMVKNTSSAKLTIKTKNTGVSSLNSIVFKLFLDKVVDNVNLTNSNSSLPMNIFISASKISIRILPANFPFGLFQFPDNLPLNRTVSR